LETTTILILVSKVDFTNQVKKNFSQICTFCLLYIKITLHWTTLLNRDFIILFHKVSSIVRNTAVHVQDRYIHRICYNFSTFPLNLCGVIIVPNTRARALRHSCRTSYWFIRLFGPWYSHWKKKKTLSPK